MYPYHGAAYKSFPDYTYAHSLHKREENRRNDVYILGGHRALTDISSAAHDMSCRTPVSNWELASRWASYAKGGNVSQAPVAYS